MNKVVRDADEAVRDIPITHFDAAVWIMWHT